MLVRDEMLHILDQLGDQATWEDVVKELYLQKKITIGLSDEELRMQELTEADVNEVFARFESTSDLPTVARNTKHYHPGNAITLGTVAGVIALLFSVVFMPVTWIAAPVAVVAGLIGLKNEEDHAWLPLMLGLVSILPMVIVFM